jgi:hypothetical protein
MTKFKNRYRIESIRLQHWDYAWNAAYFINMNTKNRRHHFGELDQQHRMILSPLGKPV